MSLNDLTLASFASLNSLSMGREFLLDILVSICELLCRAILVYIACQMPLHLIHTYPS